MGCPGCPLAPPKGLGVLAPKRKKSISPANGIDYGHISYLGNFNGFRYI